MTVAEATAPITPTTESKPPSRIRLDYLDGLRGLCALYVVLGHTYMELHWRNGGGGITPRIFHALKFLDFGYYPVDVFIVISGYCLMLPVARSSAAQLTGGVRDYLKRRARRILPPYYAALVVSLLVNAIVRRMSGSGFGTTPGPSDFAQSNLLSHLFLVHNLHPRLVFGINAPMWSVATEWQIYFLFPALLLPVWRRFGIAAAIVTGYVAGTLPHFLLHGTLDCAVPWYLCLFAMGMGGAVIGSATAPRLKALCEKTPWGLLSAALWVGLAAFGLICLGWYKSHRWTADPVVGAAAICLIIACTRALTEPRHRWPAVLRLFAARPTVNLGIFSYSLYLIHYPLLPLFHLFLLRLHLTPIARLLAMYILVVPIIILIAYLFHLAFERRFMPGHVRTTRQAAQSAVASPAP